MVAGASGVDMFLLCVAADDGVMPQTREHLAVLRHLGVSDGVVAITKADAEDPEPAAVEVADLVPGAPVVPVSALHGTGIDELRAALDQVAERLSGRAGTGDGPARLHVDRSFTLKGIGTVVTGTLWSGELGAGDSVRVLPRGLEARVRSVEVHDRPLQRAAAGQRVALNLSGVGWREVGRGDVVTSPEAELEPTYLIDVELALEPGARALPRGARLHVHHGTREAPARVVPLGGEELQPGMSGFAQLRLESPLVPAAGDRLVLRQLAPPDTVGGGVVVDPHPRKPGPGAGVLDRLGALSRGEAPPEPEPAPAEAPAPEPAPLDEAALLLGSLLRSDGERPRTDAELAAAAGLSGSEAGRRLRALEHAGQAVRVGRNLHFDPEALDRIISRVLAICEREGAATIAGVRDELGTSRKYAQVVLEHLDAAKITRRRGDEHVLRG